MCPNIDRYVQVRRRVPKRELDVVIQKYIECLFQVNREFLDSCLYLMVLPWTKWNWQNRPRMVGRHRGCGDGGSCVRMGCVSDNRQRQALKFVTIRHQAYTTHLEGAPRW